MANRPQAATTYDHVGGECVHLHASASTEAWRRRLVVCLREDDGIDEKKIGPDMGLKK